MIAYRMRLWWQHFVFTGGTLLALGSCSSESMPTPEPFDDDDPGSVRGELAVYIAKIDEETSETQYFLRDRDGEERRLRFHDAPEQLTPGTMLKVWGTAKGDSIEVARFKVAPTSSSSIGSIASPITEIGVPPRPPRIMCVAQVVVNGGPPSPNLGLPQINQQFHEGPTSVNAYYQENSYGKDGLGGQTFGPIPFPMTTCNTSGLAKSVKATLTANGVTGCDQYSFVMTPKVTACAWAGLGQVGTSDKPASDTWYNNTLGCTATVQEPGHNYGMQHSSSITCGSVPFLDNPSTCMHSEYGDKFDTMGGGCRHMNAWQKLYQKWWGGCNAIKVSSSGTFNLYPTEVPCNGVQAIQVVFPGGKTRAWQNTTLTSYYLEYRAPIGFDTGLMPQVLLHTGANPILPTQTNPRGVKVWIINASGDASNPGLVAGSKFSDPAGGLDITVTSLDSTRAVVDIAYADVGVDAGAPDAAAPDAAAPDAAAPDAGGTDAGSDGARGDGAVPLRSAAPAPPICLDGLNTVFVPPGSSECVGIPPTIFRDAGVVIIDAGTPTPVDAGRAGDAAPRADAFTPEDAGGGAADVGAGGSPGVDAGVTPPPVPPPAAEPEGGCGCKIVSGSRGTVPNTSFSLLAMAMVEWIASRRRARRRSIGAR